MAEEFLPIRFFKQRERDDGKVEPGGPSEKPKWVLVGDELEARSSMLVTSMLSSRLEGEHNEAIPYVYEVTLDGRDTAKSKRAAVVNMLDIDGANGPSHVIGMRGATKLIVRAKDDGQVQSMADRMADSQKYDIALSCITSIERFRPEVDLYEANGIYKVRLIDFKEDNAQYEQAFERHLRSEGIQFEKAAYTREMNIYRIHADEKQMRAVADGEMSETLFFIRPMPRCRAVLDGESTFALPAIMNPATNEDYPIIGVLDTGIEPIKHLQPWITGNRITPYTDADLDTRHGTFVAGVATYGDKLEHQDWVGGLPVRVFDAPVFPGDGNVDELEMVESIRRAVSQKHDEIKVWNLSLSFDTEVSDDDFSEFGKMLDEVQDDYGILICKSVGNCSFDERYAKGRLLVGSDSVRALSVGSVAHKKDIHDHAERGEASPFSRKGPGPQFITKPEVSHYGGNAGWTPGGFTRSEVYSFGTDGGPAGAVGTSFSTPRISALAANLQHMIAGDFDPLLIKALIAHSAIFPGDKLIPADEKVKEMGFGVPKSALDILADDIHTATLVLRGTLQKGATIDILDFPMPKSLIRDGYYTGQVTLTAAFAPLLASSEGGEYCQSDIDIKFGSYDEKTERDTSRPTIMNPIGRSKSTNLLRPSRYSKTSLKTADTEFALRERMLIEHEGKYAPMKKYAVDFADLTPGNRESVAANRLWYLFMKGTYRDYTEREALKNGELLEQEYCIIISIHDPLEEAPLYNEVPQLLEQHNFWHQNVQLTNQVRTMIGQSR